MTTLKSLSSKKGKKGFTLTELAIVIAVIAILIAVLVPTFTSVITNAKKTAAAEEAHSSITAYTLETYDNLDENCIIKSGDYYFTVDGGAVSTDDAYCSTDATKISGYVAYTWQESENESLPTIYASSDYLKSHTNEGFAATAATAAAEAVDTSFVGTYVYATVKDSSTTYYFTLSNSSSAYTATATSDTSVDTTKYTAATASFTPVYSGYTITLYTAASAG